MKRFKLLNFVAAALVLCGNLWAQNVAQIGSTEYATFKAAFNALQDGETLMLIADATLDEELVLGTSGNGPISGTYVIDLGGYKLTTITGLKSNSEGYDGIMDFYNVNITIKNGTIDDRTNSLGTTINILDNTIGTLEDLTINFKRNGQNYGVIGGDTKDNTAAQKPNLTMTNVTIDAEDAMGVQLGGGGTYTLNNCVFSQHDGTNTGYGNTVLAVSGGGKVTINGGTFYSTINPNSSKNKAYCAYVYNSGGQLTINGGTFFGSESVLRLDNSKNSKDYKGDPNYSGGSFIHVNDGSFSGKIQQTSAENGSGYWLKGGIYSIAPETYVAEGYKVVDNTDADTKDAYPWMIGVQSLEEVMVDEHVTYTNTSSIENVATIVSNVVTNNDGTTITQSETGDWKVKTAYGSETDYSNCSTIVDTKSIMVVLTSAVVETNVTISTTEYSTVVTSMTFDVTPKVKVITQKSGAAAETTLVEVKTFVEPITFRLPVDKAYAGKYMKVWHQETGGSGWALVGGYLVETTGEKAYIELSAKEFSFYKVEGNLWQYERTLDGYTIGTICLPRKSCTTSGAKFYRVADKKMNGSEISSIDLEEVQEDLAAGRPYVFIATSGSTKVVVCSEQSIDAASEPAAYNGLVGTFNGLNLNAFSDKNQALIFYNDQLYTSVDGDNIPANCAYILADQINSTPKQAPRIRLYNMDAQGATAVDNVVVVEEDAVIYDMMGHRLQEISAPGLYIVNGQKVFIKK